MRAKRGTLLSLASLRSMKQAQALVSFLRRTGQTCWQVLPVSAPLSQPYRGQGIGIAGQFFDNHLPEEWQSWWLSREEFVSQNQFWLPDYAHFQALVRTLKTDEWWRWPRELALRQESALRESKLKLTSEIAGFEDQQYVLYNSFLHLRRFAAENEVILSGDLPFYISRESAMVWAHQKLFLLGECGEMRLQSGVPAAPDEPFAQQYWGHPLYDWENNEIDDIMQLFYERLRFMRGWCDLVRIDHANGFFRYGAMSPEHPGWNRKLTGPGKPALVKLLGDLQRLQFGVYLEDVASDKMRLEQFMKEYELAGVSVVTLMYNVEATGKLKIRDQDLDLNRLAGNKIVFTSTHDTPTLLGWVKRLPAEVRSRLVAINNLQDHAGDAALAAQIRERVLTLPARMVIVAYQDWQASEWRYNVPGDEAQADWQHQVAAI